MCAALKGNKLKVCLKLDECAWVADKKLERLTISIVNGGLDGGPYSPRRTFGHWLHTR
jgi:hypothetical protein